MVRTISSLLLLATGIALLPATSVAQNLHATSISGSRVATAIAFPELDAEIPAPGERAGKAVLPFVSTGAEHFVPGSLPGARRDPGLPRVFAPSRPRDTYTRFPWKRNITTTVFWIGEKPTANNPVPNTVSAWDRSWTSNYGGYDNPDRDARDGYIPEKFEPGQNPFYFALPYNDISRTGTKASARAVVPWFDDAFYRSGRTVLKGRWIAIRRGDKVCYAQWEDVGPFQTDDWEYVFGDARPQTKHNRGAGLDVSPAVRDYLDFPGGYGTVDWRFVDLDEVPDGPWKQWGSNNPFANANLDDGAASEGILKVHELRERLVVSNDEESSGESAE